MVLNDKVLREMLKFEHIVILPAPSDEDIQPASIDLHLSSHLMEFSFLQKLLGFFVFVFPFLKFFIGSKCVIDISNGKVPKMKNVHIKTKRGFILWPGQSVLGSTSEFVSVPDDLVGRVEGKSSLGRVFLTAHVTAGFIDPGYQGNITLEITNLGCLPIVLRSGMKISQICFELMKEKAERPYGSSGLGSKYKGSVGTVQSKRL